MWPLATQSDRKMGIFIQPRRPPCRANGKYHELDRSPGQKPLLASAPVLPQAIRSYPLMVPLASGNASAPGVRCRGPAPQPLRPPLRRTAMTIEIHYTEDRIGLVFSAVGKVTGQDIIDAQEDVYNSAIFMHLKYWIVDRSQCTEYTVTAEDVARIAEMDNQAAKINPHLLVALVSETDLQFGISRMYEAHIDANGFKAMSFRDRATAEKWIRSELKRTH